MRISNPKLFNGQTLATKQQISAWLSGIDDASFGALSIPASKVTYGTNSNVSAQITKIYATLGLNDTGTGSFDLNDIISDISNIKSNLSTVSSALKAADTYISGIVDTKAAQADLVTVSGKVNENATAISTLTTDYKAADTYISGIVDTKAAQADLVTVSSALKDADTYISGVVDELSDWQTNFVDKTAVVEGTGLAEVTPGTVVDGVQTFTVNVPSSVAFYNHDIKLSGVTATEGYASSYALYVDGDQKGDIINIPKDQYLSSVVYDDQTNTLKFSWKLADNTITTTDVQITDLIDTISGGTGISTTGNTVSVKIKDGDKYITADASGLQTKGIDAAISAAVSDKATISTVNAIDARLSGAEGEIDALQTTVGKHATAIATAVTFEEVSLDRLSSVSSVTVEGRVMQVFDAAGWVYPEVKFITTNGAISSEVSIEEWPTSGVPGLSALVSKKVTIA